MLLGNGLLLLWWDIAPEFEADFNSWHLREHLPERVLLPGFIRGRRYLGAASGPKYFTLYEAESVAVFGSQSYLERLNDPTPWTCRVMPSFRNMKRSASRAVATAGFSDGGSIATIELHPKGPWQLIDATTISPLLPTLLQLPGVVAAHLCEPAPTPTSIPTKEQQLRVQPDATAPWVLLIETTSPTDVPEAFRLFLADQDLLDHVAMADRPDIYQMSFAVTKEDARRTPGL